MKEFPKQVVEVYLRGGAVPAVVTMQRLYPRARPGWHERAVEWLGQNVKRDSDYSTPAKQFIKFKIGDYGAVAARDVKKPLPGAQVVRVEAVLNEGRLLKVKDARNGAKTYYVMSDQLVPVTFST